MTIDEMIPEIPKFTLKATGKEYELRLPNLEDKSEFPRMVGGAENLSQIFVKREWSQIVKVIYRLLIDKSDFMATREKRVSDEGIEEEVLITGPIVFLRAIETQQEAMAVLGAFNAACMASEPVLKASIDAEKKRLNAELSIGEKSMTASPANTDLHQSSLESSPIAS